jgi:DNA-directed RNA polymerase subunit RPC12/RpoP
LRQAEETVVLIFAQTRLGIVVAAIFCVVVLLFMLLIAAVIVFGAGKAPSSTPGDDAAQCPDCGQKVSPQAIDCPKCGRRLKV